MPRYVALGFGVALLLATVAPVFGHPRSDSFPFSTYPMFGSRLSKPELLYAEGVQRRGGRTVRIPPELVSGGEVMQAMKSFRRAREAGRRGLRELCGRIADRASKKPEFADVKEIRIVSARFDPIRYFVEGPTPESPDVLRRCEVKR